MQFGRFEWPVTVCTKNRRRVQRLVAQLEVEVEYLEREVAASNDPALDRHAVDVGELDDLTGIRKADFFPPARISC